MYRSKGVLLWLGLTFASSAFAQSRMASELVNFPLEELMMMSITVSSATKREQGYFDTPAPVSVLTSEQIQAMGFTNIPDALRSFPGVHVGQISTVGWSVSIRGLGGRFSRYLLILVDGRSVYDNLLNGVSWDELNMHMGDIERIELVRGPAGTFWGANAVNGVINIISKKPTQITHNTLHVAAGNMDKQWLAGQYTQQLSMETSLKLSANYLHRDGVSTIDTDLTEGDEKNSRLNISLLHQYTKNEFDISLDLFETANDEIWQDTRLQTVAEQAERGFVYVDQQKEGFAIQGRWRHQLSTDRYITSRISYDKIDREAVIYNSTFENADIDIEYNTRLGKHWLTLGTNNRFSESAYKDNNNFIFLLSDNDSNKQSNSFFLNDVIQLTDNVELSFGGRYEDDSVSKSHSQWTARGLWKVNDNNRLWAAISESNSTPSRLLTDGDIIDFRVLPSIYLPELVTDLTSLPAGGAAIVSQNYQRFIQPVPLVLRGYTNDNFDNATVNAYELGFRSVVDDRYVLELSAFYNKYDNLLVPEVYLNGVLTAAYQYLLGETPAIVVPILYSDNGKRKSAGIELTLLYKVNDQLSLQYGGDYLNHFDEQSFDRNEAQLAINGTDVDSPAFNHRFNVIWQPNHIFSLNLQLRYVDSIALFDLPSYAVADLAMHYQPLPNWTFSLITQNLGDPHPEYYAEGFTPGLFEQNDKFMFKVKYQWGN